MLAGPVLVEGVVSTDELVVLSTVLGMLALVPVVVDLLDEGALTH